MKNNRLIKRAISIKFLASYFKITCFMAVSSIFHVPDHEYITALKCDDTHTFHTNKHQYEYK